MRNASQRNAHNTTPQHCTTTQHTRTEEQKHTHTTQPNSNTTKDTDQDTKTTKKQPDTHQHKKTNEKRRQRGGQRKEKIRDKHMFIWRKTAKHLDKVRFRVAETQNTDVRGSAARVRHSVVFFSKLQHARMASVSSRDTLKTIWKRNYALGAIYSNFACALLLPNLLSRKTFSMSSCVINSRSRFQWWACVFCKWSTLVRVPSSYSTKQPACKRSASGFRRIPKHWRLSVMASQFNREYGSRMRRTCGMKTLRNVPVVRAVKLFRSFDATNKKPTCQHEHWKEKRKTVDRQTRTAPPLDIRRSEARKTSSSFTASNSHWQ